jgi:hypothetical protein
VPRSRRAKAPPEDEVDIQADRDWGVVLNIGTMIGAAGVGGGGAVGGLGGLPTIYGASLERRLAERLWATVDGFASGEQSTSDDGSGPSGASSWNIRASFGLRHALTSPEILEVSWFGQLGAGYGQGDFLGEDSRSVQAFAVAGITLDKAFNEWIGLRLKMNLLEGDYQRYTHGDTWSSSWYVRATLSPHFGVRFAF